MRDARTRGTLLPALIVLTATALAAVFAPLLDCPPTRTVRPLPLGSHDASAFWERFQAMQRGRELPDGRGWELDCKACGGRGRLSLFRSWFPRPGGGSGDGRRDPPS